MKRHQFITTEDGSPSLATTYESGVTEKMHHFRGALSESLYIYAPAVEFALSAPEPAHVCSLGLGLGYNELITVAVALKHGAMNRLALTTFEADETLSHHFLEWLTGRSASAQWQDCYDRVAKGIGQSFDIESRALLDGLETLRRSGRFALCGRFPDAIAETSRFHAILYDAFSGKMDQDLWSEEFLSRFLNEHAAQRAVFATYAATGNLKRALRHNQFVIEPRSGFGGKKESTYAYRLPPPKSRSDCAASDSIPSRSSRPRRSDASCTPTRTRSHCPQAGSHPSRGGSTNR